MTTRDLRASLLRVVERLRAHGLDENARTTGYRATTLLDELGIEVGSTLEEDTISESPQGGELVSLGRFLLGEELGRGGMGRVLEARDGELRRDVAIKVLIDPTATSDAQLSRFVFEAQITGQLQHPNIVPVYDISVSEDGQLYFVMKKVEGRTLRSVTEALRQADPGAKREWTRHRLLTAFIQVCNAIAYAHQRGVLHRDLKPDNIMLGAFGEVLVLDWGVARIMGDTSGGERSHPVAGGPTTPGGELELKRHMTVDGAVIGTAGYMSPEQVEGALSRLDGRSDVWSLGAILYEVLTWEPAYRGNSVLKILMDSISRPPPDPRDADHRVPDEIAEICLKAMQRDPAARFQSVGELAQAVEEFLEGSARRAKAAAHVQQARGLVEEYRSVARSRDLLREREKRWQEQVEPWAPLADKAELLQVREQMEALEPDRAGLFAAIVGACERALSHDPENADARAVLAQAYWARFLEAEAEGNAADVRYYADRVRVYDTGELEALLGGTGALTLRTEPGHAEVLCQRFEQRGLIWPLSEPRSLGRTPLENLPLEMGSYLLTIRAPGRRDTGYPVHISRGRHWHSGDRPLPLYTDDEIGEGFIYVPAGPFIRGGDAEALSSWPREERHLPGFFIAVFAVTMGEYRDFLTACHSSDPDEAWARAPRQESALKDGGGQFWERPGPGEPYVVPEQDRDGDRWDPRFPVLGVSWHDALAYAAWRSERDGVTFVLTSEEQWEKAARGVDGRSFPWGNGFDATLCKMRQSRAGRPLPEPVGSFPADRSVYGARDMAGTVREWCSDLTFDDDPARRPIRGGSWINDPRGSRSATRYGTVPRTVLTNIGFRLVRPTP